MSLNVTISKNIGFSTALQAADPKGVFEYPTEWDGMSAHYGATNTTAIHLTAGTSTTKATTMLTNIEKPTCTFSLLAITTNFGLYVVSDVYNVVADSGEKKWVKIALVVHARCFVLLFLSYW